MVAMVLGKNAAKYVKHSCDGLWCPCCGYRLRTKPRNIKYKQKLRAAKKGRKNLTISQTI